MAERIHTKVSFPTEQDRKEARSHVNTRGFLFHRKSVVDI